MTNHAHNNRFSISSGDNPCEGESAEEASEVEHAALEAQQWLLENSLHAAVAAYREGLHQGLTNPVVYLVDCEDFVGGPIVRTWLGDEAVDEAIADQRYENDDEEETTVFAWAFSWEEALVETPRMFPYLREVFSHPPRDGFLAISVTAGGASALSVPSSVFDESAHEQASYDDDSDDEAADDDPSDHDEAE